MLPDILVNHDGLYGTLPDISGPAGGTFTYRAKVKLNAGPSATGVVLTEQLPVGAIFQSYSSKPTGISCTPRIAAGTVITELNKTLTCTVGSLTKANGFKTVDFNVILPSVKTDWQAFVSASLIGADGTLTAVDGDKGINNRDLRRNFTTTDASDLGVTLSTPGVGSGGINNGDKFDYVIDAANHGPSTVPPGGMVQVTFEVPSGAPVQSTPTGDGWTCLPTGLQTKGVITCNYVVPAGLGLTAGSALPQITVPAQSSMGGPIGAAVSVTAFTDVGATKELADGQKLNNTDSVIVSSTGEDYADMQLAKSVNKSMVDAQEGAITDLVYTLTAKRVEGGLTPRDITVVDRLPEDVEFSSFDAGNNKGWLCSYDEVTREISCFWAGEFTGGLNAEMPVIKFNAKVTAPKDAMLVGSRVNHAVLSMPPEVPEPNTTNNDASAPVTFNNTAQLQLNKAVIGDGRPVKKGETYQYELTVFNEGPMDVLPGQTISLSDTPSAEIALTAFTDAADWTCSGVPGVAGAVANCSTTKGLKVGESMKLVFDAKVDNLPNGAEYADWDNKASAGVAPGDRGGEAVSANATVTISDRRADVSIVKELVSPQPGPAQSGDLVTYRLTITNDALSTQNAHGLTVTDVLRDLVISKDDAAPAKGSEAQRAPYPDGGFVSAEQVGTLPAETGPVTCAASGDKTARNRTLTCPIDLLAPGSSVTIEVKILPRVGAPGTYRNTASVYSEFINDDKLTNNEDSADLELTAITDLQVVKQVAPTTAVALGEPATYTVTATNFGPSSAQNVVLVDTLPANAYLIGEPWGLNNGKCSFADAQGTPVAKGDGLKGGTMTCVWPNDLAAGNQYLASYKARSVGDNSAVGDTMDNAVKVSTTTLETRYDNNTDAVSIGLKPAELDVMIDMNHTHDGLALGELTEYSIFVENQKGSSYASMVNMTNVFPAKGSTATFSYEGQLTFIVNGTAVQDVNASMCKEPALGATAGQLECVFPLMAPGDRIEIRFKMKAESLPLGATTGTIFHSATVKPLEVEYLITGGVLENNATSDRTSTSKAAIDLSVTKTGPASSVQEGASISYQITVQNHGKAGTLSPVGSKVRDVLPIGLTFVSAKGCTYTAASREVLCEVTPFSTGDTAVFIVNATVDQPYAGSRPLINKATVTAPGDSNPDNDESETTTIIDPPPTVDFGINKVGPTKTLDAGDSATYTLTVTNAGKAGKAYTKGAKVTDVLPAGLEFVSASGGDGCTFAQATRTVSCDVPALDSGATSVFTIETKLEKPYNGARPLVNKASVSLPDDENPKNDESETTTTIVPPLDALAVPTLSQWGLIVLSALLGLMAFAHAGAMRRRKE